MNKPLQIEDRLYRIEPNRASNLLLWCIVAFFVIALVWAGLTQLDRTIRGEGKVVPSARLQTVSNLEGGMVSRILVKPGDRVAAGAPLVEFDRTQSTADLTSGQATADALSIKAARLEAEIAGRDPTFPATNDPMVAEQIRVERALHQARMSDLGSLSAANAANLAQAQRAVEEERAAVSARDASASSAQQQLAMLRPLVDSGVEPRVSLVQAESAAAVARSEEQQAQAALARAHGAVAEASARLSQQRSEWRAHAADELTAVGGDRAARQGALPALADRLRRTIVRAPMNGRINRVLVATIGGSVRPGEPVVEIVPVNYPLVIEAAIRPKDIALVRVNQPAKVSITAYDSAIYGTLTGHVVTISPDAIVDERTGLSHFLVRVVTDQAGPTSGGARMPIGPGMTADVALLGQKRSILSYLLTPITRLTERMFRE